MSKPVQLRAILDTKLRGLIYILSDDFFYTNIFVTEMTPNLLNKLRKTMYRKLYDKLDSEIGDEMQLRIIKEFK